MAKVKVSNKNEKCMVKPTSMTYKIESEFSKKDVLTLDELYSALSQDIESEMSISKLKHRIRSSIYGMKKSGKIEQIGKKTYKITE